MNRSQLLVITLLTVLLFLLILNTGGPSVSPELSTDGKNGEEVRSPASTRKKIPTFEDNRESLKGKGKSHSVETENAGYCAEVGIFRKSDVFLGTRIQPADTSQYKGARFSFPLHLTNLMQPWGVLALSGSFLFYDVIEKTQDLVRDTPDDTWVLIANENNGGFSMTAVAALGRKVMTFTALEEAVLQLEQTVAMNEWESQVIVVPAVAAAMPGKGVVYYPAGRYDNAALNEKTATTHTGADGYVFEIDVDLTTIDTELAARADEFPAEKLSLFFVQSQGDEISVLRGAENTLKKMHKDGAVLIKHDPSLITSMLHPLDAVFRYMTELGFKAFTDSLVPVTQESINEVSNHNIYYTYIKSE